MYLAAYLYFVGAWSLANCAFADENNNPPAPVYKVIFCSGWPVLVPIWILRFRYLGE